MSNQIILQPNKYSDWQRYHSGAADAIEWSEAQYTEPVSKANKESDWVVPFRQAVTSGGFAFLAVLLAVRLAGTYHIVTGVGVAWDRLAVPGLFGVVVAVAIYYIIPGTAWDKLTAAGLFGVLIAAAIYYIIPGTAWDKLTAAGLFGVVVAWAKWWGLLDDTRSLLRRAETLINRDIDGDGVVGKPAVETIRLETFDRDKDGGLKGGEFAHLPISAYKLKMFVRKIDSGTATLAQGDWIGEGGLLSKKQHTDLMDYFERAGIVRWKNEASHAQGRELTMAGYAAIANLARHA